MTAKQEAQTVTGHELTPRARSMIRRGLAAVHKQYEKLGKLGSDLDDPGSVSTARDGDNYCESLVLEFAEPGSQDALKRDQNELFGDEGPFRTDLYNIKGRPEG